MNNYKTFFENTIIDNINFEGYDLPENQSDFDKVQNVYKTFLSEYGWSIKRMGELNSFKEWLQGLPSVLTVPFYNYDILNNAKAYGFKLDSEEKEDNFLDKYWSELSEAFFTLKDNL
jgi:hypothetical protein